MATRKTTTNKTTTKRKPKTEVEMTDEEKRLAQLQAAEDAAAARAVGERSDTDKDDDDEADDEKRDDEADEDDDKKSDDERDGDDDSSASDDDRDGDDDKDADDKSDDKRAAPLDAKRAAEAAVKAERIRITKITEVARQFEMPKLGERHIGKDTTVRVFKDIVLERLAQRQAKRGNTTVAATGTPEVGGGAPHGLGSRSRDYDKGAAEARALLGIKQ